MLKNKNNIDIFDNWKLRREQKALLRKRRMTVFSKSNKNLLPVFKYNIKSVNRMVNDTTQTGRNQFLTVNKRRLMFGRYVTSFTKYYWPRTTKPSKFSWIKKKFYTLRRVRIIQKNSKFYYWAKWWKKHYPESYVPNSWELYIDSVENELLTSGRRYITRRRSIKYSRSTKLYNHRRSRYLWKRWKRKWRKFSISHIHYLRSLHKYVFLVDALPIRGVILSLTAFAPWNARKPHKLKRIIRTLFYFITLSYYNLKYLKLTHKSRNTMQSRNALSLLRTQYSNLVKHIQIYFTILNAAFFDLFLFLRKKKLYKDLSLFRLFLTFKTKRFFLNLTNRNNKTYLALTPGLFLKFLNKKKSFKKNRTIVLLMARYVRKLFLITGVRRFDVVVRNTPYMLNDILNNVLSPLGHSFQNPFTNKIINENKIKYPLIYLKLLIFQKNIPFNYMKTSSKGRIKRKILRRVVRYNRMVD